MGLPELRTMMSWDTPPRGVLSQDSPWTARVTMTTWDTLPKDLLGEANMTSQDSSWTARVTYHDVLGCSARGVLGLKQTMTSQDTFPGLPVTMMS